MLTRAEVNAIYDALVENCGANPDLREDFTRAWPECIEYRFMGALGFGGKVWAREDGTINVSCYTEDWTPEREAMTQSANDDLDRWRWR